MAESSPQSGVDGAIYAFAQYVQGLVTNDAVLIDGIARLADQYRAYGKSLTDVLVYNINLRPPDNRIPLLYAMDKILKSVPDPYSILFQPIVFPLIYDTFTRARSPEIRTALQRLVATWNNCLPPLILYNLSTIFQPAAPVPFAPVVGIGPFEQKMPRIDSPLVPKMPMMAYPQPQPQQQLLQQQPIQ